jgi:pimeloyl-ACP methyl ester carboxylesterase
MEDAMAVPELKTADIGDGRVISYRERGGGTPLVFVHGLGGRSESWVTQYDVFAARYRVIGWDAPGYGRSTPLPEPSPAIADYVEALTRFVAALGLGKFHLVGHSVGTVIAAGYHKRQGDRLLSLTLAEAVTGSGRDPAEKRAAAIRAREDELDKVGAAGFAKARTPNSLSPKAAPEIVQRAVDFAAAMNVPGYKQLFRALVNADIFGEVAPLEVPAMIVAGSDDKSAPPEMVRKIADAFPGMRHHLIDGIGHQIAMEYPERFNDLLKQFLAGQAAAAAE